MGESTRPGCLSGGHSSVDGRVLELHTDENARHPRPGAPSVICGPVLWALERRVSWALAATH